MRIYLAATSGLRDRFLDGTIRPEEVFVLESFYSMQDWQKPLLNRFKSFLLDSGAFTFLNSVKSQANADFERYADQYADFIKEYHIKHYFELDIDGIVGLKEVERLRNRIEQRSGVQSIPVWHKNRGKDYFFSMCRDYKYVSVGGIVTKEINPQLYQQLFPWFISQAHKHGAKIHGLGYTKLEGLPKYHFDSVDSTTWTMGSRIGAAMVFKNGKIIRKDSIVGGAKIRKIKDNSTINEKNFMEWIKFQKYADINLKIMVIGLISCCKVKQNKRCKAKDMYISPWFKKGMEYLSYRCDKIYIMSARYGSLSTESVITPYNQTLLKMNKKERKLWSKNVLKDIKRECDIKNDMFIIVGGAKIY